MKLKAVRYDFECGSFARWLAGKYNFNGVKYRFYVHTYNAIAHKRSGFYTNQKVNNLNSIHFIKSTID